MATPLIAVAGASYALREPPTARQVWRAVTLDVAAGEVLALVGPLGAGKTTLLHIIAGLLRPAGGTVRLDDEDVWRASPSRRRELRRGLLSLIPAGAGLAPDRSLAEQIEQPLRLARVGRRDRNARVAELVELAALDADSARLPHEVGVEARWRAGVARALALRPRIVLVDEPPAEVADAMLRLLAPVAARQGAVLLATDDAAVAARASRVVELAGGETRRPAAEPAVRLVEPPRARAGGSPT